MRRAKQQARDTVLFNSLHCILTCKGVMSSWDLVLIFIKEEGSNENFICILNTSRSQTYFFLINKSSSFISVSLSFRYYPWTSRADTSSREDRASQGAILTCNWRENNAESSATGKEKKDTLFQKQLLVMLVSVLKMVVK